MSTLKERKNGKKGTNKNAGSQRELSLFPLWLLRKLQFGPTGNAIGNQKQ